MMRALYSAVSGLKTHQTKMDVIGNNIANVNTQAFKSSSVRFSEIMYQTTSSATGGSATGSGGTNAKQIGLGVTMGATSVSVTSAGAPETTGLPFDLKLSDKQSTNFFVVSDGTNTFFTRAGDFYVDGNGYLCMSSTGYKLMGWQVGEDGNVVKDTVSPLQVMSASNKTAAPEATTLGYASGVLDKNDKNAANEGYTMTLGIYDKLGYSYTAKFTVKDGAADGQYTVNLSDIVDSNGESIFYKEYDATGNLKAYYYPAEKGTNGKKIELNEFNGINDGCLFSGGGENGLVFDTNNGTFKSIKDDSTKKLDAQGQPTADDDPNTTMLYLAKFLTTDGTNSNFENVKIDFSQMTNYNNNGASTAKLSRGDDNGEGAGKKLGALTGLSVNNDGKIYASYDNGNTELVGQISVAQFANASGLEKVGDNCYATTLNSGEFDGVGVDVSADGSSITAGQLEMSNVDLSSEFTSMIVTQRGFQANSRVITTSDTLLEELVNLKR